MRAFEIIGYTYEADIHCVDCAIKFVQQKYELAPDQMIHSRGIGFIGWKDDVWQAVEYADSEGNTLHPIFASDFGDLVSEVDNDRGGVDQYAPRCGDRKSTRLNSSHRL